MENKIKDFKNGVTVTQSIVELSEVNIFYNVRVPVIKETSITICQKPVEIVSDVVIEANDQTHAYQIALMLEDCPEIRIECPLK